jgi:hypothetical protein
MAAIFRSSAVGLALVPEISGQGKFFAVQISPLSLGGDVGPASPEVGPAVDIGVTQLLQRAERHQPAPSGYAFVSCFLPRQFLLPVIEASIRKGDQP